MSWYHLSFLVLSVVSFWVTGLKDFSSPSLQSLKGRESQSLEGQLDSGVVDGRSPSLGIIHSRCSLNARQWPTHLWACGALLKEGWAFRLTVPFWILSKKRRCPAFTLASSGARLTASPPGWREDAQESLCCLSSSASIPPFVGNQQTHRHRTHPAQVYFSLL